MSVSRRRASSALGAALAALLALWAVGPHAAQAARPGATPSNTLVIAYGAPTVDLDPATSYDSGSDAVLRGEYESLVRLKGASTTTIEGALAQSWSVGDGGKLYTFHLRHGVTFHDGTPFTADAVKASYTRELTMNQGPAFIIGQFFAPKNIKVVDPYTVQFQLARPAPSFLYAMAAQWGTYIISAAAIKKHPKDLHTWLQSHEDGTGPYMLQSFVPGQNFTLVRYPRYWAGWRGRHLTKILDRIVTSDATRREQVSRGDADIGDELQPSDLAALSKQSNVVVEDHYGMRNLSMVMTQYGPLQSTAARQAMCYAFDYHSFIADLLHGYGREAQGPMPRTVLGHDNSLFIYPTDLAKARSLLQKAGVKAGTKLVLWYQAEDEVTKAAAEVMQGQLAQLNLNLEIKPVELTTFISTYYGKAPASQRPNFFVWYWYPDYNDPGDWLYPQYSSTQVAGVGSNGGYYKNATVDRLLNKAATTADTKTRLALYKQVQRALVADPAAVWLADMPESTVIRKSLHGYVSNPAYTETYDYYAMYK